MDEIRLDKFADGVLVDDFFASACDVLVALTGDARYEIEALCPSGRRVRIALWTTRKAKISTHVRDTVSWVSVEESSNGDLRRLKAHDCSLHLEHMDRGHYWMGLSRPNEQELSIDFNAPGYLNTKVLDDAQPAN